MARNTLRVLRTTVAGNRPGAGRQFGEVWWNDADRVFGIVGSGNVNRQITGNGSLADGTAALPSISFEADPDTGVYRVAANRLGVAAGGTKAAEFRAAAALFADGTLAAPGIGFFSQPDMGMFRPAANTLAFGIGGLQGARLLWDGAASYTRFAVGPTGSPYEAAPNNSTLQIYGSDATVRPVISMRSHSALAAPTTGGGVLSFGRTFGANITDDQAVPAGVSLGSISFSGSTGAAPLAVRQTATIGAESTTLFSATTGAADVVIRTRGDADANTGIALRVTSDKRIKIGTFGTDAMPSIGWETSTNYGINLKSGSGVTGISFAALGAESVRILQAGTILAGSDTAAFQFAAGSDGAYQCYQATGGSGLGVFGTSNASASIAPLVVLSRSRGISTGGAAIVQSGDTVGMISFRASDGSAASTAVQVAAIRSFVSGTPAAGDVRGTLQLVTANGPAGAVGVGVHIDQNQNVGINNNSPSTRLHVNGPVRVGSYTVATLPDPAVVGAGSIAWCTNATGGAAHVSSNGTAWRITGTQTAP